MPNTSFPLPSREQALDAARRQIAQQLSSAELVWLVGERYDEAQTSWNIDLVHLGVQGRWVRMRHRYDAQAETLYYLGESALSDEDFRAARRAGTPFDTAAWQAR